MNPYLNVNKDNYNLLWSDLFINDISVGREKWQAIHELFFGNDPIVHAKARNIWNNEIRENALFNFYCLEDGSVFINTIQGLFGENNIIADDLISLCEAWLQCIFKCCEQKHGDSEYQILSLEKKGGQNFSHDFELTTLCEGKEHVLKLEIKCSKTSVSISDLAEFAALNTESVSGLAMFGGTSYLKHFWDNRYFANMITAVNANLPDNDKINTEYITYEAWKTTAKSVAVPKKGVAKALHELLRDDRVAKLPEKKAIVNESIGDFIKQAIGKFDVNAIQTILNEKQCDKYFCIFNPRDFTNHGFRVETIAPFAFVGVTQSANHKHKFILSEATDRQLTCDMSWGNGGAGNQNPRVLFKIANGMNSTKFRNSSL